MISKIKVLPENLANKIAAGEVIERPAAIVKELIENALDARAQSVTIALVDGGVRLIQIRDDGEGMCREDALLAFERHTTSKILSEDDLLGITTFGFRGEALPSIASVSHVRLVTRRCDQEEGSEIFLEGSVLKEIRSIGAPVGSLFEVRDLFYNVPARKKFLKSQATELAHIRHGVVCQALAHPHVQFQLMHQDRTLLNLPAVLSRRDRFSAIYGNEALAGCFEVERDLHEIKLHLFVSKAPLQKGIPKDQLLFVNGRSVKSPIVTRAVYDAYGTLLFKGDQPFYILSLDMDAAQMDINVHPTKREIRFCDTDLIYRAVKRTVHEALVGNGHVVAGNSIDTGPPSTTHKSGDGHSEQTAPHRDVPATSVSFVGNRSRDLDVSVIDVPTATRGSRLFGVAVATPLIRSMGQVYGTFLLAEVDGDLVMVDQHTAHERILYEKFKARDQNQSSLPIQPLLIPRQVELTPMQAARITDHLSLLGEAGFTLEPFGENLFLIRAVPVMLAAMDVESFLVDLSEDLPESVAERLEQPRLALFASMACHGAVRANQTLNKDQIEALLRDYFDQNIPPTCPHGRPILIKYPLPELEKLFRRT